MLNAAAARLEQYHHNKPISNLIGRKLGTLATEAISDLDRRTDDPRIAQGHLQRADELLKQFRCETFAHRNDLSLEGYEQRLTHFGEQIRATVTTPNEDAIQKCELFQEQVANHRLAKHARYADQIARTKMAVRLARWLNQPIPSSPTFGDMATAYAKELAFVDWARESIVRGDDVPHLSAAYQLLNACRCRSVTHGSARILLSGWPIGVLLDRRIRLLSVFEHVLEHVVAKAVQANNRV